MLHLSLEAINSRSPYRLSLSGNNAFCFTTDENMTYEVGFVEDHMLAVENAFQFFLVPKSETNESRDTKIQQTITSIIEEFFRNNDVLLDYICDTGDGRQAARNRLFSRWFSLYPLRHHYTLRTIEAMWENTCYFASIIIRNDNPHYEEYMAAIDAFETEIRNKLSR